jgi:hypothetical protein
VSLYGPKYMSSQKNYWFLLTFSLIVCVLCTLQLPFPQFNAAIYSSTICALIGFTLIVILKPTGLYDLYSNTINRQLSVFGIPSRVMNPYTFNITAFLLHLAPVYFYKDIYPLGNPLPIMIIWLLLFFPVMRYMYPFTELEIVGIGLATYLLFLLGTYFLVGQPK